MQAYRGFRLLRGGVRLSRFADRPAYKRASGPGYKGKRGGGYRFGETNCGFYAGRDARYVEKDYRRRVRDSLISVSALLRWCGRFRDRIRIRDRLKLSIHCPEYRNYSRPYSL